jgi:hypothetical protein
MSITKVALLALSIAALLASCKEEDDGNDVPSVPSTSLDVLAFSLLDSGNYWVYERRQVDSMDVDQGNPVRLDSLYVIGDTLLDGETFTLIRLGINGQPGNGARYYWRDSADCILDKHGAIQFSVGTFDQVFYSDSPGGPAGVTIDYTIPSAMVPVTTPSGTYSTYLVNGVATSFGGLPFVPEWKYPRHYWAQNVGRVKWYEYYSSSPLGFRYELLRYNVQ